MKKYLSILFVIVVIIAGAFFFYSSSISSVSSSDEEVIVTIEKGHGSSQILNTLNEAGLVKNELCAKIFLKLNKYEHLQSNTYIFNKNMSIKEMYDVMENPSPEYILKTKYTIIDGTSIKDVAETFSSILNISSEEILKQWKDEKFLKTLIEQYWFIDESILDKDLMYPLEGYLYPETYFCFEETPSLLSLTLEPINALSKVLEPYKEQIKELNMSIHEFLSFVSVVQRETLFEKDLSQIAGVFKNRLDINMALQSDITVNYAWQRTGVDVSIKHTQIDSPYNTYKYPGLPVGPICLVNETAIKACLDITDHDYYYFFALQDGTVIYSKTYNEHLKVVKENKWY